IMGRIMKESVRAVLEADMDFAPITLVEAERSLPIDLKITDSLTVNFKLKIDRIDISNGQMRIIDYKTGSDDNVLTDWDTYFDHIRNNHTKKAIGQVMLYAYTYNISQGQDVPIALYIYNLRKIFSSGPLQVRINKANVNDHREYLEEFITRLNSIVSEIFNPEIPFFQAPDKDACKFCDFKTMCRRD
ncbi:MAG: PD-(D/E)XK nuclease family protein, partial [Paramuribaculum sp.]|nr:PD-(D/E)XK nuclease family protein [Paramuribaculum sp.]